jgi:predicted transcriptional regulator
MDCLTQGVELNRLIPAIRKRFIYDLEKNGLKDSEIAHKLRITKSTVSQYKHKKRGKDIDFPVEVKKMIGKSVENVLSGKSANSEINKILGKMKKTKFTCCVCGVCK